MAKLHVNVHLDNDATAALWAIETAIRGLLGAAGGVKKALEELTVIVRTAKADSGLPAESTFDTRSGFDLPERRRDG